MLFSFVKELNDESASMLRALGNRQKAWQRNPGVIIWAFWIGDDQQKAEAWAAKQKLDHIYFGVASKYDLQRAGWKMGDVVTNSLVLTCREKRALITYTDLAVNDLQWLEAKLALLVGPRD